MSLAFTGKKTEGYREKMMEWKRLFLEHQTLWVDRCLLRDLWLWLCPPAMYSSIWKESSRSSCKLFMCGCLLSIMKEKKQTKDVSSCFCSRSGSLQPSVSQSQCNFVFLSAMFLIILQYIWLMSSLVYGLDTCVRRSFWESVQEDALFLLWNILCILISKRKLCFLFVVLECLYLIHLGGAGGVQKN